VHPVPSPAELRGKGGVPAAEPECPGTGQRVCIFALGEAPTVDVDGLATYLRRTYGVPLTVLPPVSLNGLEEYEGRVVNQQRHQLRGEQLLEVLKVRFPDSWRGGGVTLIAVTPHDLYYEYSDMPYNYAVRASVPGRFAIVSNARMDDRAWGGPPNADALIERTQKLVAREVGAYYFGVPLTPDPTSLMYSYTVDRARFDELPDRLDLSKATLRPLPPIPPP
jgi:predicted Zn-dependent protease